MSIRTGALHRVRVTAIVLTYNEEIHLARCIRSLAGSVNRVVVVDAYSTDRTVEIARREGAEVVQHEFQSHGMQLNWAIQRESARCDWILRVDADERVTRRLASELQQRLPHLGRDVSGVRVPLWRVFMGKRLRFGGLSGLQLVRLVRAGAGACEERLMDEHLLVRTGRIAAFSGAIVDENLRGVEEWVSKHNRYSTAEVADIVAGRGGMGSRLAEGSRTLGRYRARIYDRLPKYWRALAFFLFRYIFLLGFLDGPAGAVFHFHQGLWYRLLIDLKLGESEALAKLRVASKVGSRPGQAVASASRRGQNSCHRQSRWVGTLRRSGGMLRMRADSQASNMSCLTGGSTAVPLRMGESSLQPTGLVCVSVITATLNRADCLGQCLASIAAQTHHNYEHIVLDGGSTDGTVALVRQFCDPRVRLVVEADGGLYEAINKGVAMARGDVIGLLHSDDALADREVLAAVAAQFEDPSVDMVYGDLEYVCGTRDGRIVRHWRAGRYNPRALRWGWMPPHPTVFVRRRVYRDFGGYDTSYRIAADYDAVLRWLRKPGLHVRYVPRVLVRMRLGGVSNGSPRSIVLKSKEDLRAAKRNSVGGFSTVLMKNVRKLGQLRWRRFNG